MLTSSFLWQLCESRYCFVTSITVDKEIVQSWSCLPRLSNWIVQLEFELAYRVSSIKHFIRINVAYLVDKIMFCVEVSLI